LRPRDADLDREFIAYSEKIKLTLDDLSLRLADTLKNESGLNQRINQESLQIRDDQKKFFEKEQENSASLVEMRRLFRIFYLEVNNLRFFIDKKPGSDTSGADPGNSINPEVFSDSERAKSLLLNPASDVDGSNLSDFMDEVFAIKNLLSALNKSVDRFSDTASDPS
jgi:hypothetical protein